MYFRLKRNRTVFACPYYLQDHFEFVLAGYCRAEILHPKIIGLMDCTCASQLSQQTNAYAAEGMEPMKDNVKQATDCCCDTNSLIYL